MAEAQEKLTDEELEGIEHFAETTFTEAVGKPLFRRLIAELRSYRSAGSVGEWRPISEAPKDGTRVMLYWPDAAEGDRRYPGFWWPHIDKSGGEWVNLSDTFEFWEPTHWMPLPPAPSKGGE